MNEEVLNELNYRPSRMSSLGAQNPMEAFDCFFESFTLDECREFLWDFYSKCVMCYGLERTFHDDAAKALHFYQSTEMLIEAAWLINNRNIIKKRNKLSIEQNH